jgi:DNA-binding NarL/FixJ family response regulator
VSRNVTLLAIPQVALTQRQVDVLRLVAVGHKAPAIARMLDISTVTAEEHLEGARRALGAKSGAEAVRLGIWQGFISAAS